MNNAGGCLSSCNISDKGFGEATFLHRVTCLPSCPLYGGFGAEGFRRSSAVGHHRFWFPAKLLDSVLLTPKLAGNKEMSTSRVPLAEVTNGLRILHKQHEEKLLHLVKSSEFRGLANRADQIRYLYDQSAGLTLSDIASVFSCSNSTIYRVIHANENQQDRKCEDPLVPRRPNALLTEQEELELIHWISEQQEYGDCVTSRDVRFMAQEIYSRRTGQQITFSKHWWRSFLTRHAEKLEVTLLRSQDEDRHAVTSSSVQAYMADLLRAFQGVVDRRQILNMDETGFAVRPSKDKTKKCVTVKGHRRVPKWRDEVDASHVSLVATVNLAGESLKPFFLTVTNVGYSGSLAVLCDDFAWYKTPRGYMTHQAMIQWIDDVLEPYVHRTREQLQDPTAKIVLIMDNLRCHYNEEVRKKLSLLGNVELVWLPAHSSHLFQPLDLFPFAELKKYYARQQKQKTRPLVDGKLLRVMHAWHEASFKPNILVGWARAGIDFHRDKSRPCLDIGTFTRKCMSSCVNDADLLDIPFRLWDEENADDEQALPA